MACDVVDDDNTNKGKLNFSIDKTGFDFNSALFTFSKISLINDEGKKVEITKDITLNLGQVNSGSYLVFENLAVPAGTYKKIVFDLNFSDEINFMHSSSDHPISSPY